MTNRVIIVVDDNLASRMLPAIILRSLPLQVFECETAEGMWPLLAQHDRSEETRLNSVTRPSRMPYSS